MSSNKRKFAYVEDEDSTEEELCAPDSENEELQLVHERCMEDVLCIMNEDSPPNCDTTLALNKELQRRLMLVTQKWTELLQITQDRYEKNEAELKLLFHRKNATTKSGAFWRGRTFLYLGSMFFRDASRKGCPNNPDYEVRKLAGEIFPSDFDLIPNHIWSALDKVKVVQGVKAQVLAYLKDWQKHNAFRFKPNASDNVELHTVKLATLLKNVDDNFRIDWDEISLHDLESRHTASASEAMWKMYLQPDLNRGEWSQEENEKLREAAIKYDCQNWDAIATHVGRRSEFQCFLQHQTTVIYRVPTHLNKWNEEDDGRLLNAVKKYTVNGVVQWNLVAARFPHKQLENIKWRYTYSLNPTISHAPFTAKEDILLLAALQHYTHFANVPRTLFPNRSLAQLRSRYNNTLVDRHKRAPWSVDDDKKLLHFVAKHGRSEWSKCAQTLGNHSRISCRTRFLTIEKYVRKNPHATVDEIPRADYLKMSTVVTTQNWSEKVSEIRSNPHLSLKPMKRKRKKKIKLSKIKKLLKSSTIKTEPAVSSSIAGASIETATGCVEKNTACMEFVDETANIGRTPFEETANTSSKSYDNSQVKAKPKSRRSKQKSSRRKPLYKQRLRKLGLCLYNSFKSTYNFKCGGPTLNASRLANQALPPAMTLYGLRTRAKIKSEQSYDAAMKTLTKIISQQRRTERVATHYLPPCGSSLMAARSIEILLAQHPELPTATTPQNEHVEKFTKMMNAFLLTTCMLLQMEISASDAPSTGKRPAKELLIEKLKQKIAKKSC